MFKPQLVFFDIDDTLFRKWENFLPESVLPAFQALHEAGVMVAIATGRSPCAIPTKVQALLRPPARARFALRHGAV